MSTSASETASSSLLDLLQAQPLLLDRYAYGTAGFRYAAEVMPPVMLRVGAVARLLLDGVEGNMGVMVTASHNDESYNGVKIANPDGSMISAEQEALLVQWVNERDLEKWKTLLQEVTTTTTSILHVGYDTRSHSPALTNLLVEGAKAMQVQVQVHGILTTPMLHHVVLHSNPTLLVGGTTPAPTRQGYLQQLAQAYHAIAQALPVPSSSTLPSLQVDGACGVGYAAAVELQQALVSIDATLYEGRLQAQNPPGAGPLNTACGSEHVQKQLQPPTWYQQDSTFQAPYACSLDGDADRIVFFSQTKELLLLDGDKIAVLIAHVLQQQKDLPADLSMGVVQTAYANGASTQYLQSLNIPVVITKTGVKHLHRAALEFDIGVYFEANGHGTVLFSNKYHDFAKTSSNPLYKWLPQLINPAVGDALSDLLLVDVFLRYLQWDLNDWATQLYVDLPSRQFKVKVQDRSIVQCNANETKCTSPPALQVALEKLMASTPQGRAFVRPSGTENVVRIYAEASTRESADQLASQAAQLVYEHCQGVGPLPKI